MSESGDVYFLEVSIYLFRRDIDPPDLMIKFSIFRNPEDNAMWLLPADITDAKVAGLYRSLSRRAILELGGIKKQKSYQALFQDELSGGVKKHIVWRQGMADHILKILQKNALDRLYTLPREYMFQANLDDGCAIVDIGERVPLSKVFTGTSGRKRFGNQFGKWKLERGFEGEAPTSQDESIESVLNAEYEIAETENATNRTQESTQDEALWENKLLGQSEENSEPRSASQLTNDLITSQTVELPSATPRTAETSDEKIDSTPNESVPETIQPISDPPFISAILYLGPRDIRHDWDFKLIDISNQSLPATVFNLQRLFIDDAEALFFKRQIAGNAIAIAASEPSKNALWHVLRVAFYLEGDMEVNLVDHGHDDYTAKRAERERLKRKDYETISSRDDDVDDLESEGNEIEPNENKDGDRNDHRKYVM
jgi:hypothetical protein